MDEKQRILIVEDDESLNTTLSDQLTVWGYETRSVFDGLTALEVFAKFNPDLVLLDVNLPGLDGIGVCLRLRESSGVPIIMLTAKTDRVDELRGLEAGADDYEFKPFDKEILQWKIRARLRPPVGPKDVKELNFGPIHIDIPGHEVTRDGERISLTPLEFALLQTLVMSPKQVFSREMLLEKVWGYQYKADTRLVNVHVQRLRSKIEDDPEHPKIVVTERGVGYKAGQF